MIHKKNFGSSTDRVAADIHAKWAFVLSTYSERLKHTIIIFLSILNFHPFIFTICDIKLSIYINIIFISSAVTG